MRPLIPKQSNVGVSVITCTKRGDCINNLFNNYHRQHLSKKELIIIINKNNIPIRDYLARAYRLNNVFVYQLPEKTSLGECLNFGVNMSRYSYIAKFDDDDYYAPHYLSDAIQVFKKTNADVVGKRTHFMWLSRSKLLLLRFPNAENKFVRILPGATLVIKRKVFAKVRFSTLTVGEDDKFCKDCKAAGFKIYSARKYNFAAIRGKNSKNHTWIISDEKLLSSKKKLVLRVKNLRKFVTRSSPLFFPEERKIYYLPLPKKDRLLTL